MAADIIEKTQEFAKQVSDQRIIALVIQVHGDTKRNLSGIDCQPVAVQDVISALCQNHLKHIPKVCLGVRPGQ